MSPAPKHTRRWFRFSIRSLMVALTVFCLGVGYTLNRAHVEDISRRALLEKGFTVSNRYYDAGGTFGHIPYADNGPRGPQWLRQIVGDCLLDHIRFVDGQRSAQLADDGNGLKDADLSPLEGMKYVERLYLGFNPITDGGLALLSHLRSLRALNLAGTKITDDGLTHLTRLHNLEILVLEFTKVSDEGLRHLRSLSRLQSLHLMAAKLSGSGLEHLAGLTELKSLGISDMPLHSADLSWLTGATNLKTLYLSNTNR